MASALMPLRLSAVRGNWRKYYSRRQHPQYPELLKKLSARDGHSCVFCGFRSEQFMEIVNRDKNYDNNTLSNLVIACPLCTQCLFLEAVGLDPHFGGRLIYLPEISQVDLNHFVRLLFCAMTENSAYKGRLQALYLNLKDRFKPIDNCFGPNTSYPAIFGQGLIDTYLENKQLNHPLLKNIRLLPSRTPFKAAIEYWKKTAFAHVPL